jgi:pantetheine-phosphate adenylyltransferase
MTRVLYPGSFDPITKGHMNIVEQSSELFDEVIVAILQNPRKTPMYTTQETLEMISELYKQYDNIKVVIGTGAAVDIAVLHECKAIVRGLRSLTDYDYEVQMQQINKDISNNQVNTICLFADKEFQFISSSVVKEVFSLGKDISSYVDESIKRKLIMKRGD